MVSTNTDLFIVPPSVELGDQSKAMTLKHIGGNYSATLAKVANNFANRAIFGRPRHFRSENSYQTFARVIWPE